MKNASDFFCLYIKKDYLHDNTLTLSYCFAFIFKDIFLVKTFLNLPDEEPRFPPFTRTFPFSSSRLVPFPVTWLIFACLASFPDCVLCVCVYIFVFANLTTATNSRRAASSDNRTESKSESAEREALQTNWETGKRKYPRYR